jgi:hypothetical protein
MGQGFAPSYEDHELDEIGKVVIDPVRELANKIVGKVVTWRD